MGLEATNQHYVQEAYLRFFANDDGQVRVFDKASLRQFPTSPRNVASERCFYDPPKSLVDAGVDRLVFERAIARQEQLLLPSLQTIIERAHRSEGPTLDLLTDAYFYIFLQHLRTKSYRMGSAELAAKLAEGVDKLLGAESAEPDTYQPSPEDVLMRQMRFIFDEEASVSFVAGLTRHLAFVGRSLGRRRFYTSDTPVVRQTFLGTETRPRLGFHSPGIEISFPLSPKLILVLRDRRYFGHLAADHLSCVDLSAQNVIYHNSLQVRESRRFLISQTENFGLAKDMCQEEPRLRDPDLPRFAMA